MSYGQIFRRIMIGVTIGLLIGTFLMSFFDINGVTMMACLVFISAIISMTPEHEIDQMFCDHDYDEHESMGYITYECNICGKVKRP